ncbi:MAG: tetratricopeptide repeat protein [Desulfovibrionaceae bacterium]
MQEKIKWYQEVLELEPSSKVFFPLARLLTQTGQIDAALTTLHHGLARHPEFIEARLYLIEVLYTNNRMPQCNEQVSELTELFSNYSGFWQAWGAYLAHTSQDKDRSLALTFLAASFQNPNLRLADIFAHGLQAMQGDTSTLDSDEVPSGADMFSPENADTSFHESTENASTLPKAAIYAPPPVCVEPLPSLTVPPLAQLVQSLPTIQDESPTGIDISDDADDNEERFSLRTRSMAEVLAEQGDFKSALDIYQELATQATTPEEQLDLQHRISTLTVRMGTVQTQNTENSVVPEAAPGKHRLLSLLETLAVRFEAHAQG